MCHVHFSRSIFDWKTPRGYFLAFTFEIIAATYLNLQPAYLCSLGFGLCWLFYHLADDLKAALHSIKKYNKHDDKTETDFYGDVCKFIHFHAKIKQLSRLLNICVLSTNLIFFV